MNNYKDFENCYIYEDLLKIIDDNVINWSELANGSILVTGATGLLGSLLVKSILLKNSYTKIGVLVRNITKAKKIYGPLFDKLIIEHSDVCDDYFSIINHYSHIVHFASPTSSAFFLSNPVDVFHSIVLGTDKLLKYAVKNKVKSFIYISSMEVYGNLSKISVNENDIGIIDHTLTRSCYPVAKRTAESLCLAYRTQHNLNTKILRLTQTFEPGVSYYDNRVFAQFARSVLKNSDIILLSDGSSMREYLYTADAIRLILTVLLNSNHSTIYNISNPDSYISIKDFARLCCKLTNNKINIIYQNKPELLKKYLGYVNIRLITNNIKALNNFKMTDFETMVCNLIKYFSSLNL